MVSGSSSSPFFCGAYAVIEVQRFRHVRGDFFPISGPQQDFVPLLCDGRFLLVELVMRAHPRPREAGERVHQIFVELLVEVGQRVSGFLAPLCYGVGVQKAVDRGLVWQLDFKLSA